MTISYEWDLRTQTNTMRRPWVFDSGEEAHDVIRRCVLGPRELEPYATLASFDVAEITNESGAGSLTGGRSCDRSSNIPQQPLPEPFGQVHPSVVGLPITLRSTPGCDSPLGVHAVT
ncbi:hypothetical protein ACFV7R_45955 [Streptomyces sp. NPDC059866]|uniref:hypothetical protein n=1 Tax=Streptomyces sp. NPDC059866 TaxID=3346978 RepID=UPI00366138EE